MADCQFIAFHVWAFDRHFWDDWAAELSSYGNVQSFDRGYFGDPNKIEVDNPDDSLILFAHSFGLHLIEEQLFEQADLLIITSGFLYFHPYAAQYKRRSRLIMQEMMKELETNPKEVLHRFYENSFAPDEVPPTDFNDLDHQLLLEDLQRLQDSEMDTELLKKADKVCILHGSKDQIVTYKKGRQIYNQLQQKSQYFEIKNAGHALPKTHHRQCLEFIMPEVEQLMKTEV